MNCPVCNSHSALACTKRHHPYFKCFECEAVFTPAIDSAVLVTENDNPATRHDGRQDITRLDRIGAVGRRGLEILDFGCGRGEFVSFINTTGHHCRGIDRSTELQLPAVNAATIDAITCVEVIEHLPDPRSIFAEFHRVLRLGGIVYVETTMVDCPHRHLESWEYLDPAIGHRCVHSSKSLAYLAETAGFTLSKLNDNVWIFTRQ